MRRNQRSPEARAWQWLYRTKEWRYRRLHQLNRHPLCERCKSQGRITAATVAHHKEPHKGDPHKFFHGDLASSCKACHDSIEQSIERIGYSKETGEDGWPVDPAHPANRT